MWVLWLGACTPKATPVESTLGTQPIVAGPRAVLEQAPPPALPADTPGGGPLPSYLSVVRIAVADRLAPCLKSNAGPAPVAPALLTATIGPDGTLLGVELVRTSGADPFDQCLVRAFRTAKLPVPPPEIRGPDGNLVTPTIAFR